MWVHIIYVWVVGSISVYIIPIHKHYIHIYLPSLKCVP